MATNFLSMVSENQQCHVQLPRKIQIASVFSVRSCICVAASSEEHMHHLWGFPISSSSLLGKTEKSQLMGKWAALSWEGQDDGKSGRVKSQDCQPYQDGAHSATVSKTDVSLWTSELALLKKQNPQKWLFRKSKVNIKTEKNKNISHCFHVSLQVASGILHSLVLRMLEIFQPNPHKGPLKNIVQYY